jgi:hypothetical protein
MYWIPAVVFLAHVAEEYVRFPEWATRHFGATSRAWYVYSHIPPLTVVVWICARAQDAAPDTLWPVLATAVQWSLATNAIFHIVTTWLFREYSPGLVTATALVLPTTVYMFNRTIGEHLLTPFQVGSVVGLGTVVGGAVVASLWLSLDFDWRLRRRQASDSTNDGTQCPP